MKSMTLDLSDDLFAWLTAVKEERSAPGMKVAYADLIREALIHYRRCQNKEAAIAEQNIHNI